MTTRTVPPGVVRQLREVIAGAGVNPAGLSFRRSAQTREGRPVVVVVVEGWGDNPADILAACDAFNATTAAGLGLCEPGARIVEHKLRLWFPGA